MHSLRVCQSSRTQSSPLFCQVELISPVSSAVAAVAVTVVAVALAETVAGVAGVAALAAAADISSCRTFWLMPALWSGCYC
jgi:hypothetical protein